MSRPRSVLLIEDDESARQVALFNLKKGGFRTYEAANGEDGLAVFDPEVHDVVITDIRMPGISGMEVLQEIKRRSERTPVIVVTAYADVDLAVEAMKAGAHHLIQKPFNRDHLILTLRRALEAEELRAEAQRLRRQASPIHRPILYQSKVMEEVLSMVDKVAPTEASVLLRGESGTGKELLARRIHLQSKRSEKPFVAVNCAAVPPQLLESELFGHAKGAFTGAGKERMGKFRQAHGGTLFLDEIGDLPLELGGKLLRVLQEGQVDVLGRDGPETVDVRVVAATNQDLEKKIQQGSFRSDLYYRLNVVEIRVPPLRERRDDIEVLLHHFVKTKGQGRELFIPTEVLQTLQSRRWTGNVRELANVCERLVILSDGDRLDPAFLPPEKELQEGPPSTTETPHDSTADQAPGGLHKESWPPLPKEGLSLVDLEKEVIRRALELKEWNVSQTAEYLRVPRHILTYRMSKYGIERPR